MSADQKNAYRPDIDGLRAVAVLFVLVFHAFPNWLQGGFIGVDLFFVISGFLISQIIFAHMQAGDFSVVDFYRRRVRRIFPALLVVLCFVLVVGWFFLLSTEYSSLGRHISGAALFISNIFLYHETGYFDEAANTKPLLHLWSLGIEEQFYLVWPLLICVSWRYLKEKTIYVLMAVTFVSLGLNVAFVQSYPNWTFFLPFARMWELAVGSILAWYQVVPSKGRVQNIHARKADLLGILGLALIIVAGFFAPQLSDAMRVSTLLPVIGIGLLLAGSQHAWVQKHILSRPLLVSIGLISYPLYLWHWPLLSFGRIIENGPLDTMTASILLVVTFILAGATYALIEKPIRFGRKINVATLVIGMIVVGLLGLLISKCHGVPSRSLGGVYGKNINAAVTDWGFPGHLMKKKDHGLVYYVTSDAGPPTIVFFGDSHIEQFAPRIEQVAKAKTIGPVALVVNPGCPGGLDVHADDLQCDDAIANFKKFLMLTPSIKRVVVGGCWNCAFDAAPDREHRRYYKQGDKRLYLDTDEGRRLSLESLNHFLRSLSATYQTYLLLDNPLSTSFRPNTILGKRWVFYGGAAPDPKAIFAVDSFQIDLNKQLQKMLAGSQVKAIDQIQAVCPHHQCHALNKDLNPIYKDENHMRPFYVLQNASYLDPIFE